MTLYKWLIKNLSNVFSFLGIILTIYLGVYYIPSYVTSVRQEKINSAKKDIIITIQELLFNNDSINVDEIDNVIRGKELQYQVDIPDSSPDIILQTEATVYDQKYLNLNTRLGIISKLDSLYKKYPSTISDTSKITTIKEPSIYSSLWSIIIAIISVLISSLAAVSFFNKIKKEKEQEVINSVSEREDEIVESAQNAFEFENRIMDIVKRIVDKNPEIKLAVAFNKDRGWDFRLDYNGKTFLAEIKFLIQKSMSAIVIDRLFSSMKMMNANGIIITNKFIGLTAQAAVNAINHKSRSLRIVTIENDYENILLKILFS